MYADTHNFILQAIKEKLKKNVCWLKKLHIFIQLIINHKQNIKSIMKLFQTICKEMVSILLNNRINRTDEKEVWWISKDFASRVHHECITSASRAHKKSLLKHESIYKQLSTKNYILKFKKIF